MGGGPDVNASSLAARWRLGAGRDIHRGWPQPSLVPGRGWGEIKTGTTLVDVAWNAASDPGSIPGASTTHSQGRVGHYRDPPQAMARKTNHAQMAMLALRTGQRQSISLWKR